MQEKRASRISRENMKYMEEIDRQIISNLDMFEGIVTFKNSYRLVEANKSNLGKEWRYCYILEFDDGDFSDFIKWYKDIEIFSKVCNLSKSAVFELIEKKVKPIQNRMHQFTLQYRNISSMLELEVILINFLFSRDEIQRAVNKLLGFRYEPLSHYCINSLIQTFKDRCFDLALAIIAFRSPINIDRTLILFSFLNCLPRYLRSFCFHELLEVGEITLCKAIDFVESLADNLLNPRYGSTKAKAIKRTYEQMDSNL